ncbi:hypothetical protein CKO42_23240 [Lamprobacter modestohalophilus]|uniref:Type II toxin-antitoxin system RelE/ParE family toxin n=1 Tax=Lamprobacter modestohalophilus TaxID=1064514 RepID=A0A9X0WD27_9GAMM|nr:hypothetical protein [Lamprobacter modestohalophilus]
MRRVKILEAAAAEASAAAAWYERERSGLGAEFAAAVEAALDLLEDEGTPLSPMPAEAGARGAMRLMLRRFPYDVVVIERGDECIVVAIAHQARKPGYWRGRDRL